MKKIFIVVLILLVSLVFLGFISGKLNLSTVLPTKNNPQPTTQVLPINPIFKSQSALFQGNITKISGKTLEVESEDGQKAQFDLSDKILVYTHPDNSLISSPSADIKLITEGKVLMMLEIIDEKYQVVSISYFRSVQ